MLNFVTYTVNCLTLTNNFDLFRFWEVPEVQTAFNHLSQFSLDSNDWQVFGYLVGRAALWVSVIAAGWSMYDYFKYFLVENKRRKTADTVFAEQTTVASGK